MRFQPAALLLGMTLAAASPLASAATFGVVAQAGLAGYGATVQWGFSKYLALSAGYTGMEQSVRKVETDSATYDGDIRLSNPQVMLNWAPFGGHFRVSGGIVSQDTDFDLKASKFSDPAAAPVESVDIRGEYAKSMAPALTIGWETPLDKPGLGYHFSAGAMVAGKPEVTVSATCKSGAPQPTCDAYTASERRQVEDDLERYEILPILQAGVIFRL